LTAVRSPQDIHIAFEEAFSSGDLETLVTLYEPDAVLVAEPGRTVTGLDAIREAYRGYLALRPKMRVETVAAFENNGTALLHGRWTLQGTGPDGSEIHVQGRNTEVVRRQPDGSWLFSIDNPFTPE
jgi:uncharacterized protein (TIGR02246 family)